MCAASTRSLAASTSSFMYVRSWPSMKACLHRPEVGLEDLHRVPARRRASPRSGRSCRAAAGVNTALATRLRSTRAARGRTAIRQGAALGDRDRRQVLAVGDVADGPDRRRAGAHLRVDRHGAGLVGRDAERRRARGRRVFGLAAGGVEHGGNSRHALVGASAAGCRRPRRAARACGVPRGCELDAGTLQRRGRAPCAGLRRSRAAAARSRKNRVTATPRPRQDARELDARCSRRR